MSQIVAPDLLTYPIPDSSWAKPPFSPTSNTETFTPNYPHHAHPSSLPYSVSSIGGTSSQPTNYSLGMCVSQDCDPKNGQLCLATQDLKPSLTSLTPAVSLEYQGVLPLHAFIYIPLFRTLSLSIMPNLRVVGKICCHPPGTFLFQLGYNTHATSIWSVMAW